MTDMNEPLASAAGNAVEVEKRGRLPDRRIAIRGSRTVTLALAAEMLVVSGHRRRSGHGAGTAREALTGGKAAEVFGKMVHVLGGPADFVEKHENYLEKAPLTRRSRRPRPGMSRISTRAHRRRGGGTRRRPAAARGRHRSRGRHHRP
jgi:thymidine phosphorylase